MTDEQKASLLIELIKVGQEGKVRPDTGKSDSAQSVCNATGIVRDAKDASKYITACWETLGDLLDFNKNVIHVQDLDRPAVVKRQWEKI